MHTHFSKLFTDFLFTLTSQSTIFLFSTSESVVQSISLGSLSVWQKKVSSSSTSLHLSFVLCMSIAIFLRVRTSFTPVEKFRRFLCTNPAPQNYCLKHSDQLHLQPTFQDNLHLTACPQPIFSCWYWYICLLESIGFQSNLRCNP